MKSLAISSGVSLRGTIAASFFILSLAMLSPLANAQWIGHQTGCYAPTMEANPNRPTVANPADITQYGVLEIEYGWDRTSLGAGARVDDTVGLLKFGLLCDVELRWTTTSVLIENRQAGGQVGVGDNWFGPQIRFYHQTAHVPSLAFSYAVKAPTASTATGLGSGRVDHAFTFLASKDVYGVHFDFNATYFLVGRPAVSGFDSNGQLNLSFSRPIRGNLGITGEIYGNTELNIANPAFASSLWAITYNVSPRLVVDGGIDVGLTHGAPQKRFFAGVTYSITNLYKDLKKH
ncbi:MAG: transporter [Candidatus Acidiferrales bacterium]